MNQPFMGERHHATCGQTPVYLVWTGRWLMWVGGFKSKNRRRDFASPYLEHSKQTAEMWFGPADEWVQQTVGPKREPTQQELPYEEEPVAE